jgi:ABC-type multidrug transport system fused ATPase/permease subunit
VAISRFLEENRVSMPLAVLAVVFVILAVVFSISAAISAMRLQVGITAGAVAGAAVFGILSAIFQLLVLYQWSRAINTNVTNTRDVFLNLKDHLEDPLRGEIGFFANRSEEFIVQTWPFWVYLVFYVIGLFTGVYAIVFNILAFIFLAVYLSSVFRSIGKLSDLKDRLYQYLEDRYGVHLTGRVFRVPRRSIALFIILSIITFTIYWLYLLVRLSSEINQYLSTDETLRREVEEALSRVS